MYVILRIFRQLKINHMGDAVNVDATAGHVSSDQVLQFAFLKTVQGRKAFLLWNIAG